MRYGCPVSESCFYGKYAWIGLASDGNELAIALADEEK
jgi:hypothetical protein